MSYERKPAVPRSTYMNAPTLERSDEVLAGLVQGGDTEAFGALVERYEPKLLRYARRFLSNTEDAQDLVQDAFLKAYRDIQSFDVHKRFSPWIYRIAHNGFVDAIRRKHKEPIPFFDPDTLLPHPVSDDAPDREADLHILRATLDTHLNALDPKYREPLVLFYYEDMGYDDIADVLHLPVATVGVRLLRGRDALRRLLPSTLRP